MKICKKCGVEFPFLKRIDGKIKNLGSRKYCLDCSPMGLHNTRKLTNENGAYDIAKEKQCTRCGTVKELSEFYPKKGNKLVFSHCKECSNRQTVVRQRALKQRAVDYMGGKCQKCEITGDPSIFDFHHKIPEEKDFDLASKKLSSFNTIKPELDKCMLLCACCHRLVHVAERHNRLDLDLEKMYLEKRKGISMHLSTDG